MISRKSGVMVNVNSGVGKAGLSTLSCYCASKFGLVGLAEIRVKRWSTICKKLR